MNHFEYGFFDELQKIATVEDGTLATRGRLVNYENDRSSALRARRSGNYPIASADRRIMKMDDMANKADKHAVIGGLLGAPTGALLGLPLGATIGHALPGSGDLGMRAGGLAGIPVGAFAGTAGGALIGDRVSRSLQNLAGAARVLRANTYVRSRAAREAQGLVNKLRAFINPEQA